MPTTTYPAPPSYLTLLATLRAELMALPRPAKLAPRLMIAYWRMRTGRPHEVGVRMACGVAEALGYDVVVTLVKKGEAQP